MSAHSVADCIAAIIKRLKLDGPRSLAQRINQAVDEEGIIQQHRLEESEAGEMIALAQEIATSEGSVEDIGSVSKKGKAKKKNCIKREPEAENADVWIMKKQCVVSAL